MWELQTQRWLLPQWGRPRSLLMREAFGKLLGQSWAWTRLPWWVTKTSESWLSPLLLSSAQDSHSGCCYRTNNTIPSFSKLNFLSSLILLWVLLLCEQCFLFSALFCYLASMFTKLPFFLPCLLLSLSRSFFLKTFTSFFHPLPLFQPSVRFTFHD